MWKSSIIALMYVSFTVAFVAPACPSVVRKPTQLSGWFDKKSDAENASERAAKEDSKDAAFRDQQEILARRRNKGKMEEYNKRVEEGRRKANEKVDMWRWQRRNDGVDPLVDWKKMKAAGKLPELYEEGENEQGGIPIPSASFGVGGEFGVGGKWDEGGRFDLRLPYVDQGYVDEDSDFMGKLFGGKKTKKAAPAPPAAAAKKATGTPKPAAKGKSTVAPSTPPPAAKKGWFW